MTDRLQILRAADLLDWVAMVARHNDGAVARRLFVSVNQAGPDGIIVPKDANAETHTRRKAEVRAQVPAAAVPARPEDPAWGAWIDFTPGPDTMCPVLEAVIAGNIQLLYRRGTTEKAAPSHRWFTRADCSSEVDIVAYRYRRGVKGARQ